MIDSPIVVHSDNRVFQPGVKYAGGKGIVVARNREVIAVKWPGGTFWSGHQHQYAEPKICVFEIVKVEPYEGNYHHPAGERITVKGLIGWDNGRGQGANKSTK